MSTRYLMGLDAGSGSGRALLVDVDSGRMVTASRAWTHPPFSDGGGWGFDFDTERCWQLLAEAAREAMQRAKAQPEQVLGVAVTSMRHGLVVIDGDGGVLLAAPNRDARAAGEGIELAADHGAMLYARTGHWPMPIFFSARLRWLARHAPDRMARASAVLSISDWFTYRLCGQIVADPSQAGESLLLDLNARDWAWDVIDLLDLPRRLFPPIRSAGEVLGALTEAAAGDLGLMAGIPVAVGGADTQCGLLGVGAVQPGQMAAIAGTTTPVQRVIDQPMLDPNRRLWTGLHVVPGLWVLESNAGGMGEALEWIAGVLFPDLPRPVARLIAEAGQSTAGAGGIVSTFGAQVMNAGQMGLPIGNLTLTQFIGNDGATRRQHLARAVLEGLTYALQANVDQIRSVAGDAAAAHGDALLLAGGMSRSAVWSQMVSDVLQMPVVVSRTPEASALGAAICAGVGAGVFRDLADGAAKLSRLDRRHTPDTEQARLYHGLYGDWSRLREARAPADELAADLMVETFSEAHPSTPTRSAQDASAFRPRILVTAQMDEAGLTELRRLGDVAYASYRDALRVLTGDDLVDALQGYHVFITEVDMVDVDALQRLPDLRVVVSCRGQAVNVDAAACTAMGIPMLNAPGRNADAVADLTLAFMLMLARTLPQANVFLRQPSGEAGDMGRMGQAHEQFLGHELWGRTIGLVGLGAVGRGVARRLAIFGARILVSDPFIQPEDADLVDAELVSLDRLLAESDIVSLHAAVTDDTRGLIGAKALARMKPGALLINTARAALVDEDALIEALRSGHLGGAALDVFAIEPPASDHALLALPNVIATPHVGGNTLEVAAHQGRMIVSDLQRMLSGQAPRHILNPDTLAGFMWEGPRRSPDLAALEQLADRPAPAVSDLQLSPHPPTPSPEAKQPASGEGEERSPLSPAKEKPKMTTQLSAPDVRAQVERILRDFTTRAAADPAMIAFAAKRKVMSHYTLSDLGLEFHIGFDNGKVIANVGAPPQVAEVRMKAKAETLDGILTGRISGNRAAMGGQLSFSGDVRLAMSLQRIQSDMVRLYTAAREEAGGPGDLSSIGRQAALAQVTAPLTLDKPQDPREELVQATSELFQAGLITATGGNLSIRIEGKNESWITPSQLFKGNLNTKVMVRIDFEGNSLDADALAPSSERQVHTEIYKVRPDINAVVHAHAPYATILVLSGKPFLPISTEAAFLKELPVVPFIMPGTKELALAVVQAMGKNPAVLMQNHGVVVAASSMRRALNLLEVIERTSQLIIGCLSIGKKPPMLPKDVVKMLQEVGELMA